MVVCACGGAATEATPEPTPAPTPAADGDGAEKGDAPEPDAATPEAPAASRIIVLKEG